MRFFLARALFLTLICLAFWLALETVRANGPTFDEQGFIVRGVTYLRGELRTMRVGHPLGLNGWNSVLAAADPTIISPVPNASWNGRDFHQPAEQFMWESDNSVEKILFLTRIQTVWLYLILGVVGGWWIGQLTGRRELALAGTAFILFDPNLLAHAALATTDLGLTMAAVLCAGLFWWAWRHPGWSSAAAAGVGLALLNNTKFTAGIFVVILALIVVVLTVVELWQHGWRATWSRRRSFLIGVPLVGFVTLWGMYGFQIGRMPDSLPMAQQLSGLTLPLAHHLEQLLDIGRRASKGAPAFLLGRTSSDGWWYYFPLALVVKTPLPVWVMWILGIVYWVWGHKKDPNQRPFWSTTALFVIGPALGFLLFSLTTTVNIGFRHIMPITPFLTIAALVGWGRIKHIPLSTFNFSLSPFNFFLLTLLSFWLLATTIWISPHPLAFFNSLAGGPTKGWRLLIDSNIDWGQDLVTLARWMAEERPGKTVNLSYFGEGRPEYYDIAYRGLDSFPPRLMTPGADPLIPQRPTAGLYALSVTNLQGVHLRDPEALAWFRDREPVVRLGYSINVYEVEPFGSQQDVSLGGGLQPRDLPNSFLDQLATNQLAWRWSTSGDSWVIPAESDGILLAPETIAPLGPDCLTWSTMSAWPGVVQGDGSRCVTARPSDGTRLALDGAAMSFVEGELVIDEAAGQLLLTSWWRQEAGVTPRKIFVHLIDEKGEIVSQWDGWDIPEAGWQPNDLFFFRHHLPLPSSDSPLAVWIGVYDPAYGRRWLAADGSDRLLIEKVERGDE